MHILFVEDDRQDMRLITTVFDTLPIVQRLDKAYTYHQAMECLSNRSYHVALVDIKLQDTKDGIDLCQYIRKVYPETIILLVTGYHKTKRLKAAYESGCYDYMRKPYSRLELKLKVLRWSEMMACKQNKNKQLEYNGLVYDFNSHSYFYLGLPIKISQGCRQLLFIFMKSPEKVISRQEIQRQLWGDHDCALVKRDVSERIGALRRQLPDEIAGWIVNVFGEGDILKSS